MARRSNNLLGDLSAAANQLVADNAQKLARISGAGLTLEQRAGRVWDIPAKIEIANRIADEELLRAGPTAHNDIRDARRHGEWSRRTAVAAGPVFAEVAGIAHEAENLARSIGAHGTGGPYTMEYDGPERRPKPPTPGETMDEIRMDLRNNAEGRRAAREGRPIDDARLQAFPTMPPITALYRSPRPGRTFSGGR